MGLEFRDGDTVIRLDGDVVEVFRTQGHSRRYLLAFLRVQVQPGPIKGRLVVRMTSGPAGTPLYEILPPKAARASGDTVVEVIPFEAEPLWRQFFTQLAHLCERSVVT